MATKPWSIVRARKRLRAIVDAAGRGEAQLVTRRGRPAVYVVSAQEHEALTGASSAEPDGFVAHLLSAPKAPPELDVDELFGRGQWRLRDVDTES